MPRVLEDTITVRMEPALKEILYTHVNGSSVSSYVRRLVLKDLMEQGKISHDELVALAQR